MSQMQHGSPSQYMHHIIWTCFTAPGAGSWKPSHRTAFPSSSHLKYIHMCIPTDRFVQDIKLPHSHFCHQVDIAQELLVVRSYWWSGVVVTMKVRVALEAPVVPPETGASTRLGWAALHPRQGRASLCRELAAAAASISRAVAGSMVEESMSKPGRSPPVRVQSVSRGHDQWFLVSYVRCHTHVSVVH